MNRDTNYLGNLLGDVPEARLAVRELPMFRTCSEDLLDLAFRYGRIFSLREGEDLTREGEFDQWVFFVIDGRLEVYVEGERVDTITSSLVGERCILGEPRRATLKASRGGINALGVDMSLLDVLTNPDQAGGENLSIYLELLGRIVGEIVERVAGMEFNRMNVVHKHGILTRSERVGEIVDLLRNNGFSDDPEVGFTIHRHLARHEPVLLAGATETDPFKVDTRKVYALCLEWGRPDILYALAETVRRLSEPAHPSAAENAGQEEEPQGFSDFLKRAAEVIVIRHENAHAGEAPVQAGELRRFFSLNDELEIDLRGLTAWLGREHGYPEHELAEVLMLLLREVSGYTARVNTMLKRMLGEMKEIHFIQNLEGVEEGTLTDITEFYASTPPEDLIPFFSKNVLDVHLIQPFLKRLAEMGTAHPAAGNAPGENGDAPEASESEDLLGKLFD